MEDFSLEVINRTVCLFEGDADSRRPPGCEDLVLKWRQASDAGRKSGSSAGAIPGAGGDDGSLLFKVRHVIANMDGDFKHLNMCVDAERVR